MKEVFLVKLFDPIISPRCYGIVASKRQLRDTVKEVFLVKLFDPIISPRCYGIVASKR